MSNGELSRSGNVESSPVIDAASALHEGLARCNAGALLDELTFVDEFVNERVGVATHPVLQERLTAAGGILEWQLFGDTGDPLPLGLLKVVDKDTHGTEIKLDPRYGQDFYGIMGEWGKAGLQAFWDTRIQRRADGYETLHDQLRSLFASTPLGKRLFAFAMQPHVVPEEQPLPEYMKVARLEPIKRQLAAVFEIEPPRQVENDCSARIPLRKEIGRLELETMVVHSQNSNRDPGYEGARVYVAGLVREHFKRQDSNLEVFGLPHLSASEYPELVISTSEGEKGLKLRQILEPLIAEMYGPNDYRIEELDELAINIAYGVFDPAIASYTEYLEDGLRHAFQTNKFPVATSMIAEDAWWSLSLHAALKQPPDDAISYDQYVAMLIENPYEHRETSGYDI